MAYATLLFEIDNRRIAGCYTNKQGEFSFQIQDSSIGIWKFTAKYLEYKDKEMKVHVTSDTTLHFTMNYGSGGESQLGAVTVRAGRPLISKDKNSMTIISRDASRLPTRNLNSIASVSSSNRKSRGGISFLGSRSEGKAYFVDGVRIANNESYSKPQENVFKMVIRDPLSTVSIDVDRASYSNIRRYINSKQLQ